MALIACRECGKHISDQAEACPHCGHPLNKPPPVPQQKPLAKRNFGCGTLLLVVLALFVVASLWNAATRKTDPKPSSATRTTPSESDDAKRVRLASEMRDESQTLGSRIMAASQLEMLFPESDEGKEAKESLPQLREAHRIERIGSQWSYIDNEDPMTGKTARQAVVTSSNKHNFDFPYSGPQNARLTIRRHPQYGNDVIFSIARGQLMCGSYSGCEVKVRFGDGAPRTYKANGPADNSTETLFLRGYADFVRRMQGVDTVRIQTNVYQQGAPSWEFDVSGYKPDRMK